jgi:hypothetical protein
MRRLKGKKHEKKMVQTRAQRKYADSDYEPSDDSITNSEDSFSQNSHETIPLDIDMELCESFLESCKNGNLEPVILYCESHFLTLDITPVQVAVEADQESIVMYLLKNHRKLRLDLVLEDSNLKLLNKIMLNYSNLLMHPGFRNDLLKFRSEEFIKFINEHPGIFLKSTSLRKFILHKHLLVFLRILHYNRKIILDNPFVSMEIYLYNYELHRLLYPVTKNGKQHGQSVDLNPFIKFGSVFCNTLVFLTRVSLIFVGAFFIFLMIS